MSTTGRKSLYPANCSRDLEDLQCVITFAEWTGLPVCRAFKEEEEDEKEEEESLMLQAKLRIEQEKEHDVESRHFNATLHTSFLSLRLAFPLI